MHMHACTCTHVMCMCMCMCMLHITCTCTCCTCACACACACACYMHMHMLHMCMCMCMLHAHAHVAHVHMCKCMCMSHVVFWLVNQILARRRHVTCTCTTQSRLACLLSGWFAVFGSNSSKVAPSRVLLGTHTRARRRCSLLYHHYSLSFFEPNNDNTDNE